MRAFSLDGAVRPRFATRRPRSLANGGTGRAILPQRRAAPPKRQEVAFLGRSFLTGFFARNIAAELFNPPVESSTQGSTQGEGSAESGDKAARPAMERLRSGRDPVVLRAASPAASGGAGGGEEGERLATVGGRGSHRHFPIRPPDVAQYFPKVSLQ